MTAQIIDRDAIIEKAMQAVWGVEDGDPTPWQAAMAASEGTRATIRAALPSITDDMLAPIEAKHRPRTIDSPFDDSEYTCCAVCERTYGWPCPTAQAVAAIREAVRA